MELYVYSRDMTLQGIVEKISSLIWTRRYWSCGEFKLLVPFTEEHARLLVKENIIIKRGGNEAAEIRYIHITKNSQGMEYKQGRPRKPQERVQYDRSQGLREQVLPRRLSV